ncbi:uncharacterized protein SCHCODRAFT_02631382 [Schizophyllum commune H4-8]|uniref:uncharacterized protein n=1 Tax=Schizophyllum commune (strain H4-8 / FGSC 9210) TaxID=578458 RepID=UPI00215FC047|nr:uncharacterized protein SCHCODRAFT_02631382 [Schizophyllum commune H4-8]KAI5890279.1 hypothetical protein SCHCODRAFT_02631382 [Schizophyllum commune H4-8]
MTYAIIRRYIRGPRRASRASVCGIVTYFARAGHSTADKLMLPISHGREHVRRGHHSKF